MLSISDSIFHCFQYLGFGSHGENQPGQGLQNYIGQINDHLGSLDHHISVLLQHSSCIMHYWLFCAVTIYVRCMVRTVTTLFLYCSTAQ